MEKKYSLTNESKVEDGHIVYRIIAERDFCCIKKGTLGGFVESEDNLSHEGDCWIHKNAIVYDNAKIYDNAMVYDDAIICGNAKVYDDAEIHDNAKVYDSAMIYDNAKVFDNVLIYGCARVYDATMICDNARIYGDARVYDNAMVYENAMVYDKAQVYDYARVYGHARIYNKASISEYMSIKDAYVYCSLINNILENIRCQTGLGVFDNKVIAYKQINKDMTSFYDENFKYEVGKTIEVENAEISNRPCANGLHFSNINYWNFAEGGDTGYLMAEIDIKDIITIQRGKIRCKKAKILGAYNI